MRPFRRPIRFSLRTLLVLMTLLGSVCGYVGWQWRIVQERRALAARNWEQLERSTRSAGDSDQEGMEAMYVQVLRGIERNPDINWLRSMLGDQWQPWIIMPVGTTPDEVARAKRLFPESHIYVLTGK